MGLNVSRSQNKRRKTVAVEGLAVSIVFFLVFRPFASLGVDPHHDGVVYTTANGVSRGLVVHREVFTQYGPISAWIQGLVLRVVGGGLLTIRMTSMLVLALAAGLFYTSWRILWGRWVAATAVILWLCCAYFFSAEMPAIPWNSDYALLIQSGIALVAAITLRSSGRTSKRLLFCAGFLAGLLPFTRLNTGLLTIVALGALALFCEERRAAQTIAAGLVCSVSAIFIALLWTKSLSQWWYQGIVFPRSVYHELLGTVGQTGLRANALINGMPGVGYALLTVLVLKQFRFERFNGATRWSDYRRLLTMWMTRGVLLFVWVWLLWMADPRGFLSPLTLQWGVILAAPLLVVRRLLDDGPLNPSNLDAGLIVNLAVVAGSLGQLYPTVDLRHVWWASLPAFGLAAAELRRLVSGRIRLISLSALLLFPIVLTSMEQREVAISKYRSSIEYSPTLKGMKVEESFARAFQSRITVIKDFEDKYGSRSVLNVCQDGLWASIGGRFQLPDPFFVYWPFKNFEGSFEARRKFVEREKPFIWMCDPLADPATYAGQFGYRLVATPACVVEDPQLNAWPWKSLLAVPSDWPTLPIERRWNRQVCDSVTAEP